MTAWERREDNHDAQRTALSILSWVQRGCCSWSSTTADGRMYVAARSPIASAGWLLLLFTNTTAEGEPLIKEWYCDLQQASHAAVVYETVETIWHLEDQR
jgi:hypothetical protein